jgi:DNA-binding transcriptional MerR regulator
VAWSTRELAELAGTTVKSVRYYHQLGLLHEPERLTNGYKQYEVRHLMRLLQITRLTDLGVPLAQIESIGSSVDDPAGALRTIDAELAATIERLQRIRAELAVILENRTSASLPAGFAETGRDLSEADQSLLLIWCKVFDEGAMDDLKQMLIDSPKTAADVELDELTDDANRETRRRLGERYVPVLAAVTQRYEWLGAPGERAPRGAAFAQQTVTEAVAELYNGAQREVLYRASLIGAGKLDELAGSRRRSMPPRRSAVPRRSVARRPMSGTRVVYPCRAAPPRVPTPWEAGGELDDTRAHTGRGPAARAVRPSVGIDPQRRVSVDPLLGRGGADRAGAVRRGRHRPEDHVAREAGAGDVLRGADRRTAARHLAAGRAQADGCVLARARDRSGAAGADPRPTGGARCAAPREDDHARPHPRYSVAPGRGGRRRGSAGRTRRVAEERPRGGCRAVGAHRRPRGAGVGERCAAGAAPGHPVVGQRLHPRARAAAEQVGRADRGGRHRGGGCGDALDGVVRDGRPAGASGRLRSFWSRSRTASFSHFHHVGVRRAHTRQ